MNRCLRLRSCFLILIFSLPVSWVYSVPSRQPLPDPGRVIQAAPDTTVKPVSGVSDSLYRVLLARITDLLGQQRYEECLVVLKQAQALSPGVASIQEKIIRVEGLLAQKQKNEHEYSRLVALARSYFDKKDYLNAKASFQMALDFKPADAYARQQLDLTLELLRSQKAQNILYDVAVASADKLFYAGEYEKAKEEYSNASRIMPGEAYPKERINAIIKMMVDREVREELYREAISAGDRYYTSSSYQRALLEYQKALQQKPEESYPLERVAELQEILARLAAVDQAYKGAIGEGDRLFTDSRFDEARLAYEQALALKPAESYPASRIREIDGILARSARNNAEFEHHLNLADSFYMERDFVRARQYYLLALKVKPDESYPKAMLAKTEAGVGEQVAGEQALAEAYESYIASADNLLAAQELIRAKEEYERALAIKPEETYPQRKIEEIDGLLEAALARLQELDQQYRRIVENADRFFAEQRYPQARQQYGAALDLKPNEPYPAQKIAEVENALARLEEQRTMDADYNGAVTEANALYAAKAWESAREKYQRALQIKPAEILPVERTRAIDSILQGIADREARDERYASLIGEGDGRFNEADYAAARTAYSQALELKPKESYPQGRIREIDLLLTTIAQAEKLESDYALAVASGDSLLGIDAYSEAKKAFQRALVLKSGEGYPAEKIAEIDLLIAEQARLRKLTMQYEQVLALADQLFAREQWEQAQAGYEEARGLKPGESYPALQIQTIGKKLAELDSLRQEAERRQFEAYREAIARADLMVTGQRYEPALEAYREAALIRPSEPYPGERIKEVIAMLEELQGRRLTFDKLVSAGDQFLALRDYGKARDKFTHALELFPEAPYPRERLRLTNDRIDSIYRANRADYDKAVGEGDGYFYSFEFDRAIDAYSRATGFLPMELYPREMITKIKKTISENAIADVVSSPVVVKAGAEIKFPFDPVAIASRRNNFIYLKVKNLSANSFSILMRYGKDDQTNGGLAIRNISADGEINERLISVKDQDPWYREDNNWISLYPQGGDVEVSFIQVSRAIK